MSLLSRREFIILMATLMSLTALSIDAVLPAFSFIRDELSIQSENHVQFVVSFLFVGLMIGQLVFGPVADSYGRRTGILLGLIIFIIGSLISLLASSFALMLFGRLLQGFGSAAARVISIAIIRDLYSGRDMAQIMSFIMTVFIFVPMLAPAIGEAIITISDWRMIFAFYLSYSILLIIWVYRRLGETLPPEKKQKPSVKKILEDFSYVLKNKITMSYTIISGFIFSSFLGYLTCSQQIFQEFFNTGQMFSVYFGISAFSIGLASLINSLIVKRFGIKLICTIALTGVVLSSALFLCIYDPTSTQNFIPFMITTFIIFFCYGLLFGNMNALAMEPMANQAGTASAVIGSLSTAIALIIGGAVIGQSFNMSLWPLMMGFLCLSLISLILHIFIQRKKVPIRLSPSNP